MKIYQYSNIDRANEALADFEKRGIKVIKFIPGFASSEYGQSYAYWIVVETAPSEDAKDTKFQKIALQKVVAKP